MEMTVTGTLKLPDEEVTIYVCGEYVRHQYGPAEAYNNAKETIIAAEEKRHDKIISKLNEEKS